MNLISIGSHAPENQTRFFLLLESEFFGKNIDVWPTSLSAVTKATIHLPIQIWLFLFIPPGKLPLHKKWRGVIIFLLPTLLHFPGELLLSSRIQLNSSLCGKIPKKDHETGAQRNVHGPISITRDNAYVGCGNYNPPISFCELSLDGTVHMIQIGEWLFNNYSSSPSGLWVNSPWGRRPNGLLIQSPWGREE